MENSTNCTPVDLSCKSAISWSAIIAGSSVTAAISLCLLILGAGLGLAASSPFSGDVSAAQLTASMVIWLVIMQWASSAFGGFLTGRLRLRWLNVSQGEVFFRDTAHGFMAWVIATLLVVFLMVFAGSGIVQGGMQAAALARHSQTMTDNDSAQRAPEFQEDFNGLNPFAYYVDSLYRGVNTASSSSTAQDVKDETARIFAMNVKNEVFSDTDKAYLVQLVAAQTGISAADAAARVDDALAKISTDKEKAAAAAEEARKMGATLSLVTFLSLLVGAFIASVSAVVGGRARDQA